MLPVHEILKTFRSLGCNDEAHCYGACRAYVYLKEEKRMHDVQYSYAKELNIIYMTAKPESDANALCDVFIPVLATEGLNLVQLHRYRDTIVHPDGTRPRNIVLAICSPSSIVLLYRMTQGLKPIGGKLSSKGKSNRLPPK